MELLVPVKQSESKSVTQYAIVAPTPHLTESYHFIGIGGCGMSALAQLLQRQGHTITGSDRKQTDLTDHLIATGIPVQIGHETGSFSHPIDTVVFSAAVTSDNPELQRARKNRFKCRKYAEVLGSLSEKIPTFAIAGTHGKSTSSAWLSYMLSEAGHDPAFVIGADVSQLGGSSGAGSGRTMVVEACEYDRSFLNLQPQGAAILNIEPDHLDYYRDLDEIVEAFSEFTTKIRHTGLLVANGDDIHVNKVVESSRSNIERYSIRRPLEWSIANLSYTGGHGCFELIRHDSSLGTVRLGLPGGHNVENSLAVAALAWHIGLNARQIRHGLETFEGVGRRMTLRGEFSGITLLDDYAHHPTEIRVTLNAIRQKYQPERLWCVFQPHQHSRTRFLLDDFALSFGSADVVCLPDIYFVRDLDEHRQAVHANILAERIEREGGECHYLETFDRILDKLTAETRPGDLVVTMGAGDIWKLGDEFISRLR
jgi:UDP-N-acetylmuramate--alanine ligase